ncbi:proline--tRNA ligase [Marinicella sp. S1101]|uniref:proline--tRNA ligase n=1 Tax=Marinicella marina TaxID=2996016 RepID=UPI002260B986|nr:proline--tRNA ligase [Marinicella marina]MCX7554270.1 proline--tRNA ligase [Marinicella marina]MDJ1138739.1 proline--tRNA ligase [Marinicella marina]
MRTTAFHLVTRKETPQDAEIVSHQLMIRAGLIRKLGAGLYTWSPLGMRVLQKVENIIREEMNAAGALEMLMPAVQPKELWEETGRIADFGGQLLAIQDRAERDYFFGPTHEEVITDFVRNEINSYKQLPINFYQIQTKFRDEIRPRFGVMRSREFIMKDAYSFHLDTESLEQTYQVMKQAYSNIIKRIGLDFRCVLADSGAIGGSGSQEFHVIADSGEDAIMYSDQGEYAANLEKCEAVSLIDNRNTAEQDVKKVHTPEVKTIEAVSDFLKVESTQTIKTLLVAGVDGPVALVVRGDHNLNEVKANNLACVASPLRMLNDDEIKQVAGCDAGSIGVKDLNCHIVVDRTVANMNDFVCGANETDYHLTGMNWDRDAVYQAVEDIRDAQVGDPSPDGVGVLKVARGIEVGHIFQLGSKYSKAMNAVVLNEQGKSQAMEMGCYGMGVTRMVAAAIEQNHDDKGIIWPANIAPFGVAILPMNYQKSERVKRAADDLYEALQAQGIEVILDDRKVRPGFMMSDFELLGVPHQVIIGDRSLDENNIEYRSRINMASEKISRDTIESFLMEKIQA